jgi:hypothetical protein
MRLIVKHFVIIKRSKIKILSQKELKHFVIIIKRCKIKTLRQNEFPISPFNSKQVEKTINHQLTWRKLETWCSPVHYSALRIDWRSGLAP